tara:strand:- start:383 stop:1918 length:1536 start_codon:yes stop_codon:yes gene_type:complete
MIKIEVEDYKVNNIRNIIYTKNLLAPNWYNIKNSGYLYIWINYTNMVLNRDIKNEKDKLPVFYLGYHKGSLGYIDGSYWGSAEDIDFFKDKDSPDIEWGFQVIDFYKLGEEAKKAENKELMFRKAQQSPLYYNGNNGNSNIKEMDDNLIYKLHDDVEDALNEWMLVQDFDKYNNDEFEITLEDINIFGTNKLQLAGRKEDETVITSVSETVSSNMLEGIMSIRPVIAVRLKNGMKLYYDVIHKKFIENPFLIHGNTREQGIRDGNGSRILVLWIPINRVKDFENDYFDDLASLFNKEISEPRQTNGEDYYINRLVTKYQERNIPIDSDINYTYLKSHNIKSTLAQKIIEKAIAKRDLEVEDNALITWNTGGYSKSWKTNIKKETEKSTGVMNIKQSAGAVKVSAYGKLNLKWIEEESEPLEEIVCDLAYPLGMTVDSFRNAKSDDKNGLPYFQKILKNQPCINKNGERVKIRFRHLPTKRPKVGVDYNNIWNTPTGETFLNEYGIELEDTK